MLDGVNYIEIDDVKYPIKCDNFILGEVQEKYGSIHDFECKIIGVKKEIINGEEKYIGCEPSVKAINYILPLMINEAVDILKEDNPDCKYERVDPKKFIRSIKMDLAKLANEIHDEWKRAFVTKKHLTIQEEPKTKKKNQ